MKNRKHFNKKKKKKKKNVKGQMSRNVRKRTFWYVRLTMTQISLRVVWSNFPTGAFWIVESYVSSCVYSDQTAYCEDTQADLSLRWAHMSDGTFSHVEGLIRSDNII